MYTLVNEVSNAPENCNIGYNNSWVHVDNNAMRELYAQASYITNFDDLPISISAGNINLGAVELKDWNSGLRADVAAAGGYNALRVLSQDLESSIDDITIGDRVGNFASINEPNSALNVYITNDTSVEVTNVAELTSITIVNDSIDVTVLNPISSVDIVGPVTISNPVTSIEATFSQSPNLDAFGRLRTSSPYTLFDSSHRFSDNDLWSTLTASGGTAVFNSSEGLVDLTVPAIANAAVRRETTRVFSYQPGKSLLVMNTFVMSPGQPGLRQRVGYGRTSSGEDGIYFQVIGTGISIVRVSKSLGAEETVDQVNWSEDTLLGTGGSTNPSGITLDPTKTQIMWMDFEWLGSGTVRVGFVIEGKFIVCHKFHHANVKPTTYLSTACLPVTYEIFRGSNPGTGPASIKQICTTVLSEGGYELRGKRYHVGTSLGAPKDLTLAGTEYPVISLRLKNTRQDAIAVLSNIQTLGITNNANYQWKLVARAKTTGGAWVSGLGSVEYNTTCTGLVSGEVEASGYYVGSNQGSTPISIDKDNLFRFQLERDTLNNVFYEYVLCLATDTAGADTYCGIEWEEITR